MRVVQSQQMTISEVDIAQIRFDYESRDDIPKILKGLHNVALRTAVFELLERQIAPTTGRPGMTLWTILIYGVIQLDLNCDFDRLHELTNQHNTIREMLGHGTFSEVRYHFQTLKDNVSLLTPELLDEINQLIVSAGMVWFGKKRPTKPCVGGATPLSLKPACTFPPTSTCWVTPCARSLPSSPVGVTRWGAVTGASKRTTCARSNVSCARRKTKNVAKPNPPS
jgi:hypothetical protein